MERENTSPIEVTAMHLDDAESDLAKAKNGCIASDIAMAQARVDRLKARLLKADPIGYGAVYATQPAIVAIAQQLS